MRRSAVFTVSLWMVCAARSPASEDVLLVAPEEAPRYQLSNLRLEDDQFGRPNLVFDYRRTKDGTGTVELAGRSKQGPLRITFTPNVNRASGEVRLSKWPGIGQSSYDYEFYFVTRAHWAGKSYGTCLVSNQVRMGNPGSKVTARRWNAEEEEAYRRQQQADTPPPNLPKGYVAVSSATKLVPGMPIKAGRFGDWLSAELLALSSVNKVVVRFEGEDRGVALPREHWVAVDPDILKEAERDPDQFRPSMRVLAAGGHALPSDAEAIDPDLALPRGTPLLLHRGNDWKKVLVISDKGTKVKVRYTDHPGRFEWSHSRGELAILRDTLEELGSPDASEKFATNLREGSRFREDDSSFAGLNDRDGFGFENDPDSAFRSDIDDEFHVVDKDYPIEAALPRRTRQVPPDVELPRGVSVAYCWARKWQPSTLIADQGEHLIIKEDDNVTSIVYRIDRRQVIIEDKSLRKLERMQADKAGNLTKKLRTWTDSSGQHKIEAYFVSVAEGNVTLKTDAGREIILPLERLSDDDQLLLKNIPSASDNPFE